jgi:hypothetical protein
MTISRVKNVSYLPYAREMNVWFQQANVLVNSAKWNLLAIFVYKIIISQHLWGYFYWHGIPLYDQSVKSWEFRIREIRYCWEGNTMLLREKYDVLINVTWDCFDQSNFCISRINIIEWNRIIYLPITGPERTYKDQIQEKEIILEVDTRLSLKAYRLSELNIFCLY